MAYIRLQDDEPDYPDHPVPVRQFFHVFKMFYGIICCSMVFVLCCSMMFFVVIWCSRVIIMFYNLFPLQLLVQHDDPDHPGLGRRLLPPQGLPHESG